MRIANWLGRAIRTAVDSTSEAIVAATKATYSTTTSAASDFHLGLKGVDVTRNHRRNIPIKKKV